MDKKVDLRNLNTTENRDYWSFVEKTADEVASWPDWLKGEARKVPGQKTSPLEKKAQRRMAKGL